MGEQQRRHLPDCGARCRQLARGAARTGISCFLSRSRFLPSSFHAPAVLSIMFDLPVCDSVCVCVCVCVCARAYIWEGLEKYPAMVWMLLSSTNKGTFYSQGLRTAENNYGH